MKKLVLLLCTYLPFIVFCQVIHIPGDFSTIQEGIDAAESGDTVLVDPGTYYENLYIQAKDITLASHFLISLDTNYIAQTIIDGNGNTTTLFVDNLSEQSSITGFTIQNGDATGSNGGGIAMIESSALLSYLVVKNNTASWGGGIFCGGYHLHLNHVQVINNTAVEDGGGIRTTNAVVDISNCILSDNEATAGAAAMFRYNTQEFQIFTMNIQSSTITGNACPGQTAGLYFRRTEGVSELHLSINSCLFKDNYAGANGALQIRGEEFDYNIINCRFIHNQVESYTAGAALIMGCDGKFMNCIFADNEAALNGEYWNGGGCTLWGSEAQFYNCTFTGNHAPYGAGLVVGPNAEAFLLNNIFRDNMNQQIIAVDFNDIGGILHIDYNNIHYGMDSIRVDPLSQLDWGEHNIDADPLFAGSGEEYALSNGSPCIDSGIPDTSGMNYMPYDILWNNRVWDGDGNGTAIVDMGAYEFDAPVWVGIDDPVIYMDVNNSIIRIFPNPCRDYINIVYQSAGEGIVEGAFYTADGIMVKAFRRFAVAGGNIFEINLNGLNSGVYFIRLQNQKWIGSSMIIIKK